MKPQTMLPGKFFSEVCILLGLDYTDCDEDDVIRAIQEMKRDLDAAERASEINYLEWQKLATKFSE